MPSSRLLAVALASMAVPPAASAQTADRAAVAAAPDPRSLETAHAIVAVAFPPDRREAMMDKVMSTMMDQMKGGAGLDAITDPELRAMILSYIENVPQMLRPTTIAFIPKQMDALGQAYARMFSPAELKDILAFARTPSGQAFLQRSTDVLSDPAVARVNGEFFKQAQQINLRSQTELQGKVQAYLKTHPGAVPQDADVRGED